MAIDLKPGENVFYPMPYIDTEVNLLVITNQRLVHFGDAGKQEVPAREISFIGRMSRRPFVAAAVILILLGLTSLGLGIYWIFSSGLIGSAKTAVTANDDPSVVQAEEPDEEDKPPPEDTTVYKILGCVLAPLGLIFILIGVLLVRVNRHIVLVRGGAAVVEIRVKSPMEQMQILATLGSIQSAGKAAAPAAAAKAPAVKVDDKGDPVKALQELAAQRAAGKVSQEEFDAKREVLVQRVRGRK
jgi:hypothetical protein